MKLQLMSDLHTEFWNRGRTMNHKQVDQLTSLVADADVLALLGDVAVGCENVEYVLNTLSPYYDKILYVPGNHEYYGSDITELDDIKLPANAVMLNPATYTYKGVVFAGATLWSKAAPREINDFRAIKNFKTGKHLNALHNEFLATHKHDVTLTHFLPIVDVVSPRYRGSFLNPYFVGDCKTDAQLHCFGHTHDACDMVLDKRYVCNPYGYHGHEVTNSQKVVITL